MFLAGNIAQGYFNFLPVKGKETSTPATSGISPGRMWLFFLPTRRKDHLSIPVRTQWLQSIKVQIRNWEGWGLQGLCYLRFPRIQLRRIRTSSREFRILLERGTLLHRRTVREQGSLRITSFKRGLCFRWWILSEFLCREAGQRLLLSWISRARTLCRRQKVSSSQGLGEWGFLMKNRRFDGLTHGWFVERHWMHTTIIQHTWILFFSEGMCEGVPWETPNT